jgi:cytochrome oxidase Cu insertion factor (SCO1/SenC/PrrC family)
MSNDVTDDVTDGVPPPPGLSEAERSAAFHQRGPTVPSKFIVLVVGVLAVLGVGGAVLDHVLSDAGLNGASAASTTVPVTSGIVAPPAAPSTPPVGSPLPALLGIVSLPGTPAPAATLVDPSGHRVALTGFPGDVVVLTFFDAPCTDICPVLSSELVHAAADLGPAAARVVFLTVNTDPLQLSGAPAAAAAAGTGLAGVATWHFLTGDLDQLNQVWTSYGVTVNVNPSSGMVAHNDVLYFIDPTGRLRYRATPFADESRSGTFTLGAATVDRWAQGIATYARQLQAGSP